MSDDVKTISEAEMQIMKVLWDADKPLNSNEISAQLSSNSWKLTTVITMSNRLVKKGILISKKDGRTYTYHPALSRKEYQALETKKFIDKTYKGSMRNFIASLVDDVKIDNDELLEIKKWFSEKSEGE